MKITTHENETNYIIFVYFVTITLSREYQTCSWKVNISDEPVIWITEVKLNLKLN